MKFLKLIVLILITLPTLAFATTYYVNASGGLDSNPGTSATSPKLTIQAAINAAMAGDVISVADGMYKENLEIEKPVLLIALTALKVTINGNQSGHCIHISSSAAGCVIDGLILYDGKPTNGGNTYGGGIDCSGDATIRNCHFKNNGNSNLTFAGGIHTTDGAEVLLYNCLLTGNTAYASGGAALSEAGSTCTFDRCTLYGNKCTGFNMVGGISVANSGTIEVKNSIVWGNEDRQIDAFSAGGTGWHKNVSYSCISGGQTGTGNIASNPKFNDVSAGDFSLQSSSPCIDAGNPTDTDPDGTRVDMGFSAKRLSDRSVLPVENSLVAWYKFDGNAKDSSGNQHDLVGSAVTWGADRNGATSAAAYFSGNGYLTPSSWFAVQNSMTISVWVKPSANISLSSTGVASLSGAVVYPSHGASTGRAGLGLFVGKNGIVVGEHAANYNPAVLVYSSDIGEKWTFVTVTISDNGSPILYVNGDYVAKGDATTKAKYLGASNAENNCASLIGGGRTFYYQGGMDNLRIFNKALTASEVESLYTLNEAVDKPQKGLVHRWSFNGDLADSVGGCIASVVGGVTTDGVCYKTPGGKSGSAYIDLGDDLVPMGVEAVALEIWATQDSRGTYDRVFDFGSMPAGYDFTRYDTSCYTSDNIIMYWSSRPVSSFDLAGTWSMDVGRQYHIAVSYQKGEAGRWDVTYYVQPADGSEPLCKVGSSAPVGWSFDDVGRTEWLLGQPLTCWDSCAKISYDEVRIWNRSLSESDFSANTLLGPDVLPDGCGQETSCTITFDSNGGSANPSAITRDKDELYGVLPVVTRVGFAFDGWYSERSGGVKVVATTVVKGDATLYAHWSLLPVGCGEMLATDSLVAWCGFNGELSDASGNEHHLVDVLSNIGYCMDRNGAENGAACLDGNALTLDRGNVKLTGPWTFACWFKTSMTTSLHDEKTGGIALDGALDSSIRYLMFNGGCCIAVGANGVNVFNHGPSYFPATLRYDADLGDGWHHLAVTLEEPGKSHRLYIDGRLVRIGLEPGQATELQLSERTENGIGGRGYYGSSFNGSIDDLCIFDRSLDAYEIEALYGLSSDHSGVVTKQAVEPTSGKPGMTAEIKCSRCGELLQAATEVPALGFIRNVTARQLWPHKKIEICYEVADDIGTVMGENAELVLISGNVLAKTVLDDAGWTPGRHCVVWDMEADGVEMQGDNVQIRVSNHKPHVPGFFKKTFHTSSLVFDTTSDLWNGGATIVNRPEELYVTSLAEHTTVAYGCYMTMTGGVTYNFKGCYDDFAAVKVNGSWVVGKGNECKEVSGSFKATSTGLYRVEFRVGNNGGVGGCQNPNEYGVKWNSSADSTWRLVENGAAGDLFFVDQVSYDGVEIKGESDGVEINTSSSVKDGMTVSQSVKLGYSPVGARAVELLIDGTTVLSSEESGEYIWMPLSLGTHTLKHVAGDRTWTRTVNVTSLAFATSPQPKPPMTADENVKIVQDSHAFTKEAGSFAIQVQGVGGYTGNYTVSVSDPSWITVNSPETNWKAGRPLVYGVTANSGVEERVGYVYISGHVHTITQAGVGAELSEECVDVEGDGGAVEVTALADAGVTWNVRPNVDWLSVSPTSGVGEGTVTITVAPWNDVSRRVGTVTVAGKTFTVRQTGRHMKLDKNSVGVDWQSHVVDVTVNALSDTDWGVCEMPSWVSVVGSAGATGGGTLALSVNENPSFATRSGVVKVGTEKLAVSQSGRPTAALTFEINPERTSASVKGANGLISVSATPDLPWSTKSGANWLTIMPTYGEGAGNGNVIYTATPNPTMAERTGTIIVTPDAKSGLAARTHTVVQPAATSLVSEGEHAFDAKGDSFDVQVSVSDNVGWSVTGGADWIDFGGTAMRYGPGTVTIAVSENLTVDQREATLVIAGHEFRIFQPGRSVELEYESIVFGPEGGQGSLDVNPDGNVRWMASPSDSSWIGIWGDDNCDYDADGNIISIGSGTVNYYVSAYVGDGEAVTGFIQIGDRRVYLTQRAYDLDISPNGTAVGGNAGEGQVGVPATVGQIWNAIATEPWITIVSGYDAGSGSGTVRYTFADNNTGVTRTGKIIISGEEYTITQAARQLVTMKVRGEGGDGSVDGGSVSGAGVYDRGATVTLTAVAADGYEFAGWTLPGGSGSMSNPLVVTADVDKEIGATFSRIPMYAVNGESVRGGTVKTFTAPEPTADGGMKLVCKGTSAFPEKGTSFQLKITEDVSFEWDLWETNYLLTVESPEHGRIMEGDTVAVTHWVARGETVTLNAIADGGYTFFRWTGGAEASGEAATGVVRMDSAKTVGAVFGVFDDTIASAADAPGLAFVTGGDAEWHPVVDASVSTGYTSVRSGAIGKESETWLETTVPAAYSFSFDWRVDCEKDDSGLATWDRLTVFTNGVEAARIDGTTEWRCVTFSFPKPTTVRWSFYRDDWDEASEQHLNCGWIDNISCLFKPEPVK